MRFIRRRRNNPPLARLFTLAASGRVTVPGGRSVMEHRMQIEAIVKEALAQWTAGKEEFVAAWAEVRRQLRRLRDTSTSLREDERAALQLLRQLQTRPA
jgi:hypothetical protein